jgi:mono/diheme cytochrome c family protein
LKGRKIMAPRNAIRSFLSLLLMIPMMLLTSLTACSKSKTSGGTASALAPVQGGADANASGSDSDSDEDSSTSLEDCDKDEEVEAEDEGKEDEDADAEKAGLKADNTNKGKTTKKECPAPGTAPSTTTPTAGGTASLAEGQKLYTANCQGCHGALPGEEQGASAPTILNASGVGAHKGITPWPAGAGSALSAQDAAASLAAAMK